MKIFMLLATPGLVLGVMFSPFAFDNPRPSSILFALYGICVSGLVSIVVTPLLLIYGLIWFLRKSIPSSIINRIDGYILPISIKYFNKLPIKVRHKIGNFIASIDTPTLLNMHEAGFKIIPNDLKWLIRMRKEKKL